MRLTRAIPAGLVDAGLTSLATFIINLYAIGKWQGLDPPVLLGVYYLFMTAFIMASTVPNQMLFVPAEKFTLNTPQPARTAFYGRIMRLGLPVALLAALLVTPAAAVGLSKGVPLSDQAPLLITAYVAAVFFPLQNHSRRLLHLAGRSWAAATVSLAQIGTATISLITLNTMPLATQWVPIGSLAAANIASTTTAAIMIRRFNRAIDPESSRIAADELSGLDYRRLAPSGRWLVGTGVLSTGNNFLVESAVSFLVGLPALALAGAAKTVAQPILVLAEGLRSVLGPRSMEAAKDYDRPAARHAARLLSLLTATAVVGYIGVAGFDWVGNPLARVVDDAYTIPLLVALTIVANGLNGAAFSGRMELIGAGKEPRLFVAEVRANAVQLAVAIVVAAAARGSVTAGAFARPVAFASLGGSRLVAYERALDDHYREPRPRTGRPTTLPASSEVPPEVT